MRIWGLCLLLAACGGSNNDNAILNPARDAYGTWEKVELPGTVCGNDSQYKIWVNWSKDSDNLVVVLEPGGACWDYDSCTGANGVLGAANVDGLPDDHYQLAPFISPFLNRDYADSPSKQWNMVYIPYCTGDVHTGNAVATYGGGSGSSIEFHHEGHADMEAVVSWLDGEFTHVPKMLVTGCSAGGVGSLVNYHFLRNGVHAAEKGYLLDDSGPVFPDPGYSTMMHTRSARRGTSTRSRPTCPPASRSRTWARSTPRSPTSSPRTASRRHSSSATTTSRSTPTTASTAARRRIR